MKAKTRVTGSRDRTAERAEGAPLRFEPLTDRTWPAFEALFGERGACAGCWCMYWRMARREYDAQRGAGTKRAMRRLVTKGRPTGVLAFEGSRAVGWCAIAPREDYPVLARSRILSPVDDQPVWSVVCFFVEKSSRRKGITAALLRAAAEHARKHGARIVEGYPVDPMGKQKVDTFVYTGLAPAFRKAGFVEIARRSETRPIMRLSLGGLSLQGYGGQLLVADRQLQVAAYDTRGDLQFAGLVPGEQTVPQRIFHQWLKNQLGHQGVFCFRR